MITFFMVSRRHIPQHAVGLNDDAEDQNKGNDADDPHDAVDPLLDCHGRKKSQGHERLAEGGSDVKEDRRKEEGLDHDGEEQTELPAEVRGQDTVGLHMTEQERQHGNGAASLQDGASVFPRVLQQVCRVFGKHHDAHPQDHMHDQCAKEQIGQEFRHAGIVDEVHIGIHLVARVDKKQQDRQQPEEGIGFFQFHAFAFLRSKAVARLRPPLLYPKCRFPCCVLQ